MTLPKIYYMLLYHCAVLAWYVTAFKLVFILYAYGALEICDTG